MSTADRMAVLDQGVVQQVGTPEALYDDPVNAFVAGFVGTMNLLPARVLAQAAGSVLLAVDGVGELKLVRPASLPASPQLQLSFRPHALCLQAADAARDERLAWLPGTVEASEFLGSATRYRVRVGSHALAVDELHVAGMKKAAVGAAVWLGLEPSQVRFLAA